MTETDKPAWPTLADGSTDWEAVFEDPQSGLIPLITQAQTAPALRECAIVVVRQLHTRKKDPDVVAGFVAQLEEMVPDNLPAGALPKVAGAIAGVLRQIKEDRIRRAAAHAPGAVRPPTAANEEAGVDPEAGADGIAAYDGEDWADGERRRDGGGGEVPRFVIEEERPPYAMIGGILAAILLVAVGGYAWLVPPSGPTDAETNKRFVAEMKSAVQGEGPKRHVFGGALGLSELAGRRAVTAERVPPGACESVAWTLAQQGNIMISGVMPNRVQPPVLKKLCAEKLLGATLIWLPRKR